MVLFRRTKERNVIILRVFVHQPHFAPWLPYFRRIQTSDIFLVLDNANFRKGYFQNRTVLPDQKNEISWATMPVSSSVRTAINSTRVSNHFRARRKLLNLFSEIARLTPEKSSEGQFIEEIILILKNEKDNLASLNLKIIKWTMNYLAINSDVQLFSKMTHLSFSRTTILDALIDIGASEVIGGFGKIKHVNPVDQWQQRGINLISLTPSASFLEDHPLRKFGLSVAYEIAKFGLEGTKKNLLACSVVKQ